MNLQQNKQMEGGSGRFPSIMDLRSQNSCRLPRSAASPAHESKGRKPKETNEVMVPRTRVTLTASHRNRKEGHGRLPATGARRHAG